MPRTSREVPRRRFGRQRCIRRGSNFRPVIALRGWWFCQSHPPGSGPAHPRGPRTFRGNTDPALSLGLHPCPSYRGPRSAFGLDDPWVPEDAAGRTVRFVAGVLEGSALGRGPSVLSDPRLCTSGRRDSASCAWDLPSGLNPAANSRGEPATERTPRSLSVWCGTEMRAAPRC